MLHQSWICLQSLAKWFASYLWHLKHHFGSGRSFRGPVCLPLINNPFLMALLAASGDLNPMIVCATFWSFFLAAMGQIQHALSIESRGRLFIAVILSCSKSESGTNEVRMNSTITWYCLSLKAARLLKCVMNLSRTLSVSNQLAASLDDRWSSRSPLLCSWAPSTLGSGAGSSDWSVSVTFSIARFAFSVSSCGDIPDKPRDSCLLMLQYLFHLYRL